MDPPERRRRRSLRTELVAALLAGATILVTAGAASSATAAGGSRDAAAAVGAQPIDPTATSPTGPGVCRAVTYTPPTASRPQQGTLCVPEVVASDTTIVLVHGGGGRGGSRHDAVAWQDHYAAHGVVSLSIDYALLDDTADSARYPLPEQNVMAAVQYTRLHQADLGTERVVVQGHSAGARLGAIVLTGAGDDSFAGPELWGGVSAAVNGFVGFYGYYDGTQYDGAAYFAATAGAGWSAEAEADRASGPVLLFHAADDGIVPVDRSTSFAGALDSAGRDVDLEVVSTGNHTFDGYSASRLGPAGLDAAAKIRAWLSSGRPPRLAAEPAVTR